MKRLFLSNKGEWADDVKNGFGTYTYANGDTYEGEWSNNLRHGQGTYTYADSGVKVRYSRLIPRHPRNFVATLSNGQLGMKLKTRQELD